MNMRLLCSGGLALIFITGCACNQKMGAMHAEDKPVAAMTSSESVAQTPNFEGKSAVRSMKALKAGEVKPANEIKATNETKGANKRPLVRAAHKVSGEGRIQSESPASKIDLAMLTKRLKNTDAIGVFTKLAIRSDIMDLKDEIESYRQKAVLQAKLKDARAKFDGLLMKIVALLEADPDLSSDLYSARESIWKSLLGVKA